MEKILMNLNHGIPWMVMMSRKSIDNSMSRDHPMMSKDNSQSQSKDPITDQDISQRIHGIMSLMIKCSDHQSTRAIMDLRMMTSNMSQSLKELHTDQV